MRAYLILVRLRRPPEYCVDDLERLKGALPACTRAIVFDERVIGIATKGEYTPLEILQDFAVELRPFTTIGVYELGTLSASTDNSSDPFNLWMEWNCRRGKRRESDDAEDMLKKKWGQRRIKDTEYGGVGDAIRKVFASWPKGKTESP